MNQTQIASLSSEITPDLMERRFTASIQYALAGLTGVLLPLPPSAVVTSGSHLQQKRVGNSVIYSSHYH